MKKNEVYKNLLYILIYLLIIGVPLNIYYEASLTYYNFFDIFDIFMFISNIWYGYYLFVLLLILATYLLLLRSHSISFKMAYNNFKDFFRDSRKIARLQIVTGTIFFFLTLIFAVFFLFLLFNNFVSVANGISRGYADTSQALNGTDYQPMSHFGQYVAFENVARFDFISSLGIVIIGSIMLLLLSISLILQGFSNLQK